MIHEINFPGQIGAHGILYGFTFFFVGDERNPPDVDRVYSIDRGFPGEFMTGIDPAIVDELSEGAKVGAMADMFHKFVDMDQSFKEVASLDDEELEKR